MAAQGSPLGAAMASQLIERLSAARRTQGAGGAGMAPGLSGGGAGRSATESDAADQQLSQQFGELQNADPQMMLKTLRALKGMLVALYVRAAFNVPGVARNCAQAQKYIDGAIKEAQQAAATLNSVRPPITNNASIPMSLGSSSDAGAGAL